MNGGGKCEKITSCGASTPCWPRNIPKSPVYIFFAQHIFAAINLLESKPKHIIFTGSTGVFTKLPSFDADLKRDAELFIEKKYDVPWTIIRPTNIWGPWNYNYPNGLYKAIENGLYFNPSTMTAYKSYGFVLNIVDQIISILFADLNKTDSQVFYVGEKPMFSKKWVKFSPAKIQLDIA